MIQFKYQKGQALIAIVGGMETIVTIDHPYDCGGEPYYETQEGHDISEDDLEEVSEFQMEMTFEGAERLADLFNKRDCLLAKWRSAYESNSSSPICKVYLKAADLVADEIRKLETFYSQR